MSTREEDLIYDWNRVGEQGGPKPPPRLVDHTLACARLSSWVNMPDLDGQRAILRGLQKLGLHHLCLGSWADGQVRALLDSCSELAVQGWAEAPPGPMPAPPLGAYLSHRYKHWRNRAQQSHGPVVLVIQDVSRRTPNEIAALLAAIPGTPISACCLSDDGGRATPAGTTQLVNFVSRALARMELNLEIEWSGRNDRGLALANALHAWRAGAHTLHSSFFSLGEGCGLVATEQLLVNLSLSGSLRRDLGSLSQVSQQAAEILGMDIYPNQPILGADAFRTGTGVHAAAILKAHKKGHDWLADLIYSGVPAGQFGFRQVIEVGPMAGASNVLYWLEQNGLQSTPERVQAILNRAKSSQKVLHDDEIKALVSQHGEESS